MILAPLLVTYLLLVSSVQGFTEDERVAEYHARNWTWPIPEFKPNTEGWDRLMRHRLRQVEEIEERMERFEGFAQTLTAALIQPNYTEVRLWRSCFTSGCLLVFAVTELLFRLFRSFSVRIWGSTGS
jgi:hypothetical protein